MSIRIFNNMVMFGLIGISISNAAFAGKLTDIGEILKKVQHFQVISNPNSKHKYRGYLKYFGGNDNNIPIFLNNGQDFFAQGGWRGLDQGIYIYGDSLNDIIDTFTKNLGLQASSNSTVESHLMKRLLHEKDLEIDAFNLQGVGAPIACSVSIGEKHPGSENWKKRDLLGGKAPNFLDALTNALNEKYKKNAINIHKSTLPIETAIQLAIDEFGSNAIEEALSQLEFQNLWHQDDTILNSNNKELHKLIAMDYSTYLKQVSLRMDKNHPNFRQTIFDTIQEKHSSSVAK